VFQSGWCRVLKVIESGGAAHLVADNTQDEGVQFSWGICSFFLRAMSSGKKGHPCSPFFQGPNDFFRWDFGFPGWLYHCRSEPCLANQRSVSQQSWSLWGVTS